MWVKRSANIFQRIGLTFQVLKTALAAGLSWFVATTFIDSPYPVFAPLAAILIIQVAIFDTLERAFYRVIGAIGGVIIGIFISIWLPLNTLSITLVVFISFMLSTALKLPAYLLIQISISALLVLFFGQTEGYAFARIMETLVGSVIGVMVNILVFPPNPVPRFYRRVPELCNQTASLLHGLEMSKETNKNVMKSLLKARDIVVQAEDLYQEIESAKRNLRYSPLQRKSRVEIKQVIEHIKVFEHVSIQVRGIVRSLFDISTKTDKIYNLDKTLKSVSGCLVLFGSYVSHSNKVSVELLKDSLRIAEEELKSNYYIIHEREKDSEIIMNIGSIFTDFNRIILEIREAVKNDESSS